MMVIYMTQLLKKPKKVLILGQGYVGSRLLACFPDAQSTRRSHFELNRPETWKQNEDLFTSAETVIWTFPAASEETDEELALKFFDRHLYHAQVMIYGTTSAYRVKATHEWIDENSELNLDQVRTRTEENLRKKGACILHLSGIFGPGRLPLNWYLRGLVQFGSSYLNLIHVDDIVAITEKLTHHHEIAGQRINLSNGKPKTHLQIVSELKSLGLIAQDFTLSEKEKLDSKRVSNKKIKTLLNLPDSYFTDYP